MFYSIRHVTRFRYSQPVHESVMELRMQPRSEGAQSLRNFQIVTNPRAQLYAYTDYLGNAVYHFNVLRAHEELRVDVQAVVEINPRPPQRRAACERLAGRLKAAVDFGQIDELMGGSIDTFLVEIARQCEEIHEAVYAAYIAYGAETVL